MKPFDTSPPDSWLSLSALAPELSELSAGLLLYAPFPVELPFFVNASNKAKEGGVKKSKQAKDKLHGKSFSSVSCVMF